MAALLKLAGSFAGLDWLVVVATVPVLALVRVLALVAVMMPPMVSVLSRLMLTLVL